MAMTPLERKQKQLDRERDALRVMSDSSYSYLSKPFFERLEQDPNWSSVQLCFELMGIEAPEFHDDRGPAAVALEHCFSSDEGRDEAFSGYEGSVGRAEAMVGLLLDAAMELASIIQAHKLIELDARLREIEALDLSDPDERKGAFEAAVHIGKVKDALNGNVRRTIPQWQVKGV
jgi:hypothetical protein